MGVERLGFTLRDAHMARVMDEAAARMRHARRERVCVWCDDPVPDRFTYPACEACRVEHEVVAA